MNQLSLTFARARRDHGIQQAGDHAGERWRKSARGYLLEYIARHPRSQFPDGVTFLAEDIREYAEAHGFDRPPDGRAWGVVFQSAAREGLIRKAGYAPARSSNLSPKVLWAAT